LIPITPHGISKTIITSWGRGGHGVRKGKVQTRDTILVSPFSPRVHAGLLYRGSCIQQQNPAWTRRLNGVVRFCALLLLKPTQLPVSELDLWECRIRRSPLDGVFDHFQHVFIVVGWKRFVARAEVDDLASAAGPGAPRAEYCPAAEAADEEGAFGLGDVEEFAVHFLAREDEIIVESG